MRKSLSALAFLMVAATLSPADTVFLTNRSVVSGTVVEITDQSIVVHTEQGLMEVRKETIEKIEYSDRLDRLQRRNAALSIRSPMLTVLYAVTAELYLSLAAQTAVTRSFGIGSVGWISSYGENMSWSVAVGPELRPRGDYLQGFSLGVYGGLRFFGESYDLSPAGHVELAYQAVDKSGAVFALVSGASASSGTLWGYAALQFGVTFKHPFIRARPPRSTLPGSPAARG